MIKSKKNKTIIIGKSGNGKSFMALELGLKRKGTTVICNGHVDKSYYAKNFPDLKEYENKDNKYSFIAEKGGKYYICAKGCNSTIEFINALIHGCGYGKLGNDKKATIIYDDGAWEDSKNNLITLWQLSHMDCGIIITADSIYDILKVNENELTDKMFMDISKYWNIIKLGK